MAGVYDYLPLGLLTLNNINRVIREEMNSIGSQEILLSTLQNQELWSATNRWQDDQVDVWFKTELRTGTSVGLGFTHEEPLTNLLRDHVNSYRDLPFSTYQIQTKFRNETRAKSGIMRGREFLMKDMYSFSKNEEEHNVFYENAKRAYLKVFGRLGLGQKTYVTFAAGGSFSKYSHEFQTLTSAGEDTISICDKCHVAVNKEIIADQPNCPVCGGNLSHEEKGVEVGNIFSLGTRFSDILGLNFVDEGGQKKAVVMGCYGIGPSRLMGTIIELNSNESSVVWPREVAPFDVHIIEILGKEGEEIRSAGEGLYDALKRAGVDVLYDDRNISAGEKFADADLIGIPVRVVIGRKYLEKGVIEVNERDNGKEQEVLLKDVDSLVEALQK
jgi:prolyl-tRNA synthetase